MFDLFPTFPVMKNRCCDAILTLDVEKPSSKPSVESNENVSLSDY
jgi:hypothetical protein